MLVKTTSGSQYIFTDKGNKTYVMKGLMEGILAEPLKGLEVGSNLTINFHKCSPCTYEPQEDISTIITTPITEIVY